MYVRGRIYFVAPWPMYVRVHATCVPLLRHVRTSTSTSMYIHVRNQNDNATYASTRWVPTVRQFLACENVAGGSQQSEGRIVFFVKYGGLSGGSLLSGGGIIILHVIRRHFLAAAWTQLSASPCTVLFRWKSVVHHIDHAAPRAPGRWSGRRRGLGR